MSSENILTKRTHLSRICQKKPPQLSSLIKLLDLRNKYWKQLPNNVTCINGAFEAKLIFERKC